MNTVLFLLFPGAEELDFVGPWEMITMWRSYANGPEIVTTVAERSGAIACAKGLTVLADHDFTTAPQADILVVPGGFAAFDEAKNSNLTEFVAQQARGARYVLSVCTGSFILHAAGLLAGRRAATHWKGHAAMAALPDVTLVKERFVEDGPIWTSAGVSAGTDLALAFIAAVAGADAAGIVQYNAEYYPDPRVYGDAIDGADPALYFARR